MGEAIWLERRKWPDISHYRHQGWLLGEDEHGTWFELKVGSPVFRGDDLLFHGTSAGLMVVPPGGTPWLGWFPAHGTFELYVDVVAPADRHEDGSITMVDLDFDVIRHRDGRIELVDEDEFVEHQVLYSYPPEIVALAKSAAQSVLDAVRRNEPPFDGTAAATWAARAGIDLDAESRPAPTDPRSRG